MGWLKVVSIGPGNLQDITPHVLKTLKTAEVVVGYKSYLQRIQPLLKENVTVIEGGMGEEIKRVQEALKRVSRGQKVCVVSGGDAGIYGMAGLVLETIAREKIELKIEIIPGVSAINAVAAALGAPLNQDFAVISLSDLLVPWEIIARRLEAASWGDFVIVLFNPASTKRIYTFVKAVEIINQHRPGETPVGFVWNVDQEKEKIVITNLSRALDYPVDMQTTIVVGTMKTFQYENWMITPRGYKW